MEQVKLQVCKELVASRNSLIDYLHKVAFNENFDQNHKWQEMRLQISVIDQLLRDILKEDDTRI